MNWRQFKTDSTGFKGIKGFKLPEPPPIKPLKPLIPEEVGLKNAFPATEAELFDLIRQTVAELDAAGSWEGFGQGLTPEVRQSIKAIEARIDSTYAERNRQGLTAALLDYREVCLKAQRSTERRNWR